MNQESQSQVTLPAWVKRLKWWLIGIPASLLGIGILLATCNGTEEEDAKPDREEVVVTQPKAEAPVCPDDHVVTIPRGTTGQRYDVPPFCEFWVQSRTPNGAYTYIVNGDEDSPRLRLPLSHPHQSDLELGSVNFFRIDVPESFQHKGETVTNPVREVTLAVWFEPKSAKKTRSSLPDLSY